MTPPRSTWNFHSAGRILFGRGSVRELGPAVQRLRVSRVLIICDPVLESLGFVERVQPQLAASGIEAQLFSGGEAEPSFACAEAAIASARRHRPDCILGLGGGSNIDLAKIVAIVAAHGGGIRDYVGFDNVPGPVLPLVAVPTTSGTGSEVSHAAVLTDTEQRLKVSTLSQYLRPSLAVVDPELTLTCPRQVTADSGIDALTHAIEAYVATHSHDMEIPAGTTFAYEGKHPLGDVFAERAIALVAAHLVTAVREPQNMAAREGMSLAALMAGLAFSNCGVALVHAMEYPLGGDVHCTHGAGNGLLLPHVMRFNVPVRQREFARIAALLGEDVAGLDDLAAAHAACDRVSRLLDEIGIPQTIRELGGRAESLAAYASKAFAIKRLMQLTPRSPSEADILAIYRAAY